jgi:hypothetical protein
MTPQRIEGPATIANCAGCKREGIAGTEAFTSASTGIGREPEAWYWLGSDAYCAECAAKFVEEDPTRSRSQFYTDTTGENIRPEIFQN